MTERLVTNKGQCVTCISCIEESNCKVECGAIDDCLDKLAEYETAYEEGRLMILPCKLGDVVYEIHSRYTYCTPYRERFDESSCCGCEEECDSHKEYEIIETKVCTLEIIAYNIRLGNFGKTVFLTREEAEKALEDMKK